MKNLNEVENKNGPVMTGKVMTSSDGVENPFIFSSAMYQTLPARHSSARSRDREQVRFMIKLDNLIAISNTSNYF